jgi:hypothetical protein
MKGASGKEKTMHRSFGIETHPKSSTTWKTVKQGPSLAEVREHLRKIECYKQIFG